MPPTRILFLAANPSLTQKLDLEREARTLQERLRSLDSEQKIDFRSEWKVRAEALPELLRIYKPHIVHFSGHGSRDGELLLSGVADEASPVALETLQRLLLELSSRPQCVVLNACHSAEKAPVLAQAVPIVVAMAGSIGDDAAATFTAGFYAALADGENVQSALNFGRVQLELAGRADYREQPQLFIKEGVDPTKLSLLKTLEEDLGAVSRDLEVEVAYRDRLAAEFDPKDYLVEPLLLVRHPTRQRLAFPGPQTPAAFAMSTSTAVLLGSNGSGKTSLVRLLVHMMARTGELRSDIGMPTSLWHALARPLLPVLLPLRVLNTVRQGNQRPADLLTAAVAHAALQYGFEEQDLRSLFMQALANGRLFFAGDGLNEILDPEVRAWVEHQILELRRRAPKLRILITSQTRLPIGAALAEHVATAELQGLTLPQVKMFLQRAAQVGVLPGASSDDPLGPMGHSLLAEIQDDPRLTEWAQWPQRLAIMVALKTSRRQGTRLSSSLVELFAHYVESRLEAYAIAALPAQSPPAVAVRVRHHLAKLALWMLQTGVFSCPLHVLKRQLIEIIQDGAVDLDAQATAAREAETLLRFIPTHAGLLVAEPLHRMAFVHSSFLQYLAAHALATMPAENRWQLLRPRLRDASWREPIALCCAQLSLTGGGRQLLAQLLDEADRATEAAPPELFLTLAAAVEAGVSDLPVLAPLVEKLAVLFESRIPTVRSQSLQGLCQLARLGNPDAQQLLAKMLMAPRPAPLLIRALRTVTDEAPHGALATRIRELLEHRAAEVRAAAIYALERMIQRDPVLREQIFSMLDSRDPEVRIAAYHALMPLFSQDDATNSQLRKRLKADNPDAIQAAFLQDGAQLVEDDGVRALVYELLGGVSGSLRGTLLAVLTVRVLQDDDDCRRLLDALQDPDPEVSGQVLTMLCFMGRFRADIRDAVLSRIGGDWPPAASLSSMARLFQQLYGLHFLDVSDLVVWGVLRAKLSHPSPLVREFVVKAVGASAPQLPEVADSLFQLVADDVQPGIIRQAAIASLLPLMTQRQSWQPVMARRVQGQSANALVPMIHAVSLAAPKNRLLVARLRAMLAKGIPADARIALLDVLAYYRPAWREAVAALIRMLTDADPAVVRQTFLCLAPRLRAADLSIPEVRACFSHSQAEVRRTALDWLKSLGPRVASNRDACAILRDRLSDQDPIVFMLATALLFAPARRDPRLFADCFVAAVRFNDAHSDPRQHFPLIMFLFLFQVSRQRTAILAELRAKDPQLAARVAVGFAWGKAVAKDPRAVAQVVSASLDQASTGISALLLWHRLNSVSKRMGAKLAKLLQPYLHSENDRQKMSAATALLGLGRQEQLDGIVTALQDVPSGPEPEARLLTTIAQLTRPAPDMQRLFAMLQDKDMQQRLFALNFLLQQPVTSIDHASTLLPWLGVVMESPRDGLIVVTFGPSVNGAELRRRVAERLAPWLAKEPDLRARIEAMLRSSRWQARQGAGWALSLMSQDLDDQLAEKLCGLLEDLRSPDDDILERLQAARALCAMSAGLPAPTQSFLELSQEGLRFGLEPWELIPNWAREVRLCAVELATALPETDEAIQLLEHTQDHDPDEVVKESAYRALCSRGHRAKEPVTA